VTSYLKGGPGKCDEAGGGNFFSESRDVIYERPLTLTLSLVLILTFILILTLTLTLTLSLILTLTRTAACGNYFPVRQIFHYTGIITFSLVLTTVQNFAPIGRCILDISS